MQKSALFQCFALQVHNHLTGGCTNKQLTELEKVLGGSAGQHIQQPAAFGLVESQTSSP